MNTSCQHAFDVFLEYEPALLAFIRKRVPDQATAEDLKQEVLLKLHNHCGKLEQVRNVRSWVFQVTYNTIADFYRSQQKAPQVDLPDLPAMDEVELDLTDEVTKCVHSLIRGLPEEYQQPIKMADILGLPQQAIADQLGLSLSATKSRIQRARQKVKTQFAERCEPYKDQACSDPAESNCGISCSQE